jgi:hypothetical protein
MRDAYSDQESDEWDAIRGTELFKIRKIIDKQNSWVAFSHRITLYWKFDEFYFASLERTRFGLFLTILLTANF